MAEETEAAAKKGKKKLVIVPVLVLLLGIAGGGYFMMKPKPAAAVDPNAPTTTTTVAHGQIVRLAPITMNLTDGHVLKVGIALQFVEKPKDAHLAALLGGGGGHGATKPDPDSPLGGAEAKALDEAIHELGDMTYDDLSKPAAKLHAKEKLGHQISELYHGDVTEVYFTNFVMS